MKYTLLHLSMALASFAASAAQITSQSAANDTMAANTFIEHGRAHLRNARHDSSIFYFEKARDICERLTRSSNEPALWMKYLICLNGISDNLWRKAEYEKARATLEQALALGPQKLGESHAEVATSHYYLGSLYRDTGEYAKAATYLNKSLRAYRQSVGENSPKTASAYNALGILYHFKGDYDQALEHFERAHAIRRATLGENHPAIALGYNNIGNEFVITGDYYRAIAYFEKALALRLALLGADHPQVGDCYNNLGAAYHRLGDYEQAIANLDKAVTIWTSAYGEDHPDVALSVYTLGEVYEAKGDAAKARDYFQKALAIRVRAFGEEHLDVAQSYYSLGNAHARLNQDEAAMQNYRRALELLHRLFGENHANLAQAHHRIAELRLRQNHLDSALVHAQLALRSLIPSYKNEEIYVTPALNATSSPRDLLFALELKARLLRERYARQSHETKDLQAALSVYQLASELLDKTRSDYDEASKLFWGRQAAALFSQAILASLQTYEATREPAYKERAFFFVEKSKAAVLKQALQESRAKKFSGIPAALLAQEKALRIDLAFYETEMQKTGNDGGEKTRALSDSLFEREREYEKLIAQLEQAHPRYYALKYRAQVATIAELQNALDSRTALLEYVLGDSVGFAFAVTKNGFDVAPIKRDSLFDRTVTAFAHALKNETSRREYLASATRLYQLLLKPLELQIASKPRWIIIPDAELYQIPFEALLTADAPPAFDADYRTLPYLIKQREISYHHSATLFLQSRQTASSIHAANLFAGFAPVFSSIKQNGKLPAIDLGAGLSFTAARPDKTAHSAITRDGENLVELKFSEREVRDIAALFGRGGKTYLHREASEENFKQNAGVYKYVHLATHGLVDSESPQSSRFALSQPDAQNAAEDGFLYSSETYNLTLNAELLTLSSCESGVGKLVEGEGLMALTRGFLYSGARNIVASLWKVYDEHTSRLMVEMYREIATGKSYSSALRAAKLKMIADPATAAPQSWAGFVLIGR